MTADFRFHSTVLPETKPLPVTVRVKSPPPAGMEAGANVLATGITDQVLPRNAAGEQQEARGEGGSKWSQRFAWQNRSHPSGPSAFPRERLGQPGETQGCTKTPTNLDRTTTIEWWNRVQEISLTGAGVWDDAVHKGILSLSRTRLPAFRLRIPHQAKVGVDQGAVRSKMHVGTGKQHVVVVVATPEGLTVSSLKIPE